MKDKKKQPHTIDVCNHCEKNGNCQFQTHKLVCVRRCLMDMIAKMPIQKAANIFHGREQFKQPTIIA